MPHALQCKDRFNLQRCLCTVRNVQSNIYRLPFCTDFYSYAKYFTCFFQWLNRWIVHIEAESLSFWQKQFFLLNILKRLLKTIFQRFKHVLHCVCLVKDVILCNGDSATWGQLNKRPMQPRFYLLLKSMCSHCWQTFAYLHIKQA